MIYCLYQRPGDPGLWLCTRSGLYRLDPASGRFEGWRHDPADPDSIAADFVAAMLQDRAGRVWVATVDGGLDRFDPASGRFEHFRHDPAHPASLSSNRVQALYEDSQGTLWVGTSAGVNRLETGPDGKVRFRVFGSREGLAADSIGAFLEDAGGQLWVSGTAGLARLDPRNWTVRNYSAADGLPGGSYFVGAALRDADGTLYFGGVKGLTAVAPDRVRGNPVPPPVAITDFQVFNRSIAEQLPEGLEADAPWPATRRLRMPTSLSVFTIAFAALHYADPARNQYAYRLEGFDSDWLRTGADRRFATYTNLDPGRYVFRVRAANKDGIWNEEGAALEIVITPPWWRTWWFRIGGLLALAAAAIVLYRRRIHRLQRQQATLEQRVEERTFELEQARMDLEQASLTDPLTGMRNRRFLRQQLDSDLALSVRAYQRAALHGWRRRRTWTCSCSWSTSTTSSGSTTSRAMPPATRSWSRSMRACARCCVRPTTWCAGAARSSWWWPAAPAARPRRWWPSTSAKCSPTSRSCCRTAPAWSRPARSASPACPWCRRTRRRWTGTRRWT